jgi:hypothetical protein
MSFLIISYVFSLIKLEKRVENSCLEAGVRGALGSLHKQYIHMYINVKSIK